jgi:hypothetical protein
MSKNVKKQMDMNGFNHMHGRNYMALIIIPTFTILKIHQKAMDEREGRKNGGKGESSHS